VVHAVCGPVPGSQLTLLCCAACFQNYTKPKKIAHKHKKYPLAVLKFYRVDDDGKITRLRRECPNETCGSGVFMATHFDRHYCGKCGLTYKHEK
jgi:small subunit ribosomal protein S27Ae